MAERQALVRWAIPFNPNPAVKQNQLLTRSFFFLMPGQEFSEQLLHLFGHQVFTLAQKKTPYFLTTGSSRPTFLVSVLPATCWDQSQVAALLLPFPGL